MFIIIEMERGHRHDTIDFRRWDITAGQWHSDLRAAGVL